MAGQRRTSGIDVNSADFLRGLRKELAAIEVREERDVVRLAIDVENRAKQLCAVDTGRLRSSITHQDGRDARGFFVEVGTRVTYAPFVEYGTSRARAQPFIRPALAESVAAFRRRGQR